jgi:elongation factor Ts
MAEITASMVKDLRERTGLGMMECKKALAETDGDMTKAEDLLRIKSGAKANKAAGRTAAEGMVASYVSPDGKIGGLVEINCETDFVAKNDDFVALSKALAQLVAEKNPADIEALMGMTLPSGEVVEEARKALVMKLGENINVRRIARFETSGKLSTYLHGNKIGVMVDYSGGDETMGKDIAMHIAASKPVCVSKDQVPSELVEREREIAKARALESGKPENIVDKIVEGTIAKYLAEVTLMGQPFVKNPDQTVEKLLAANKAAVTAFTMFVVGEGIEKKVVDYAAEVAAASKV